MFKTLYKMMMALSVTYHCTSRCDLRCKHCYIGHKDSDNELSTKEALDLISDLRKIGTQQLIITGGEPILRNDLLTIISYAKSCGFCVEICSNATKIDDVYARKLAYAGVDKVQVSLDGMKSLHEWMRGKGTFEPTIKGIGSLISNGIPTTISTVLTSINFNDIPKLRKLARALGAEYRLINFIPLGSGSEYRHLVPRNCKVSNRGKAACMAGVKSFSIESNGDVLACEFLRDKRAGNMRRESIEKIWNSSDYFKELRKEVYVGCRALDKLEL
jgi:MoaA/NifB/PqqE/SkfB family radical SAM enzyme